jgi:hypothetical protein
VMVVADEDRTVPLTENPVPPDPEPEEPSGIPKLSTAEQADPEFVTVGEDPVESDVTVPRLILHPVSWRGRAAVLGV